MMGRKVLHHAEKALVLFLCGAGVYSGMEIIWRGHTHWTMAVLGGALFLVLGGLNEWLPWEMPLLAQGLLGALIVTAAEFCAGYVLNILLGLGIWDYSRLPLNLMGQICLPFSLIWWAVSIFGIVLDDWIRYWIFKEERPHYKII